MNPCSHFYPLSSAHGLDSEGVCLTCGTAWSMADIEAAVNASRADLADCDTVAIQSHCRNCGDVYTNRDTITVEYGSHGAMWSFPCPDCGLDVYHGLTDAHEDLLRIAGVKFPISPREVQDFKIALGFNIMQILEREMAA